MNGMSKLFHMAYGLTLSLILVAPPPGTGLENSLTNNVSAHCMCSTFTVDNESSYVVGEVEVTNGPTQYTDIDVTGFGNFSGDVCFTPNCIVINGQSVAYPMTGSVELPEGQSITVSWTSSSLVVLKDTQGWDRAE